MMKNTRSHASGRGKARRWTSSKEKMLVDDLLSLAMRGVGMKGELRDDFDLCLMSVFCDAVG